MLLIFQKYNHDFQIPNILSNILPNWSMKNLYIL